MTHILRDGSEVKDPRLDRLKFQDPRSRNFSIAEVLPDKPFRSYTWWTDRRLDQGQEGACVGFGWTHELSARPMQVPMLTDATARALYHLFQKNDEWEGGAYPGANPFYEGTSVLAGAKFVKLLGHMKEYRWAFTLEDFMLAVGYKGPGVIGVDWYEGMFNTDARGFIHPTGDIGGGHCVCVLGIKIIRNADGSVNYDKSYFLILNSWGPGWGQNGLCMMTLSEFNVLRPGGDFCIPVTRLKVAV